MGLRGSGVNGIGSGRVSARATSIVPGEDEDAAGESEEEDADDLMLGPDGSFSGKSHLTLS